MKRHTISFKHAFSGLVYNLTTQPNFRIHIFFASLAITLGFYLKILRWEWLVLILTILLVIAAEMVNTALEAMTDLITEEYKENAKIAKDTAAGMVLVTAIGSVIVGIFILGPRLLNIVY